MEFKVTDSHTFVYGVETIIHEAWDGNVFMHRLVVILCDGRRTEGDAVPYRSIATCNGWYAACAYWEGIFTPEHPFRIVYADPKK